MIEHWAKYLFLAAALAVGAWSVICRPLADTAEAKALAYLRREVPAWYQNNACFSCHNNGDAARALYAATRKGYRLPAEVLSTTTAWVSQPKNWDENKGDPGFSDKRLADVQFAASLLAAVEAGQVTDRRPLEEAARKLVMQQDIDGAWRIESGNTPGSPATYGTPLATWMALRVLRAAGLAETATAGQKAESWLRKVKPGNLPAAATLLLARAKCDECLNLMRRAQTRDGGWGPYVDAPPEPFDTAIVLLALAAQKSERGVAAMIQRGRAYLIAQQTAEGNWPPTTRPAGGDSYAQMMSTTGWATLALLETQR